MDPLSAQILQALMAGSDPFEQDGYQYFRSGQGRQGGYGIDLPSQTGPEGWEPARKKIGGDTVDFYDPSGAYRTSGADVGKFGLKDLATIAAVIGGPMMLGGALTGGSLGGMGGMFGGGEALAGTAALPEATSLGLSFDLAPGVLESGLGAFPSAGASPFTFGLPSVGIGDSLLSNAATLSNAAGGGAGLSIPKALTNLAGAAIGAASNKDQQQTTTREPWGPAQDWIKSNIAQGQQLQKQYTDQPFSPQQQTQYNNLGGLLNSINQGAGGLFQGFGASGAGQNNFDRTNPRKQLTGSSFNLGNFAPGLLSFFGGK